MKPDQTKEPAEEQVTEQDRIDEAMAESFPASDPPSWPAGVRHKEDQITEDSSEEQAPKKS